MKNFILIIFFSSVCSLIKAQTPEVYFDTSANQYIDGDKKVALNTVNQGIQKFPNDSKLKALRDKMLEEEQNQDQQDQQKNDQEKKDEQNKENQDQQDQEQENQDQQDQEKKDGEQKDGDQEKQQEQQQEGEQSDEEKKNDNQEMSTKEKLEQMNISEEKAKMILEAMKNNEIQYIQQQRRKPTKAPQSGKPDW